MATKNEFLGFRAPLGTKEKLEEKAEKAKFLNYSEYLRHLVRCDLEKEDDQ
jgi:Arc/MetJ-type ribon-helix-helix transcriptional regulator